MSLDFPIRADWLKIRATPRALPIRPLIHVRAPLVTVMNPVTSRMETVVGRGNTLNLGSNKRKQKRALLNTKAARKESRRLAYDRHLERLEDASLYANEDFDAMKREQEEAA